MSAIYNILGLVAGNFIYQSWNGHDWLVAFDKSYFQATAIFTYWLALKLTSKWIGEV